MQPASPSSPTPPPSAEAHRPRLPGFEDALGNRVLLFETSSSSWLQLLRFKPEFSNAPAFEAALRQRLTVLGALRHPAIASVRKVERLAAGGGLILVSTHAAGRRLAEIQEAHGPAFALELIGQVAPALAALHLQGAGIAHGLLTADRVVITREGRAILTEYVLGSAVAALSLPADRLRSQFHVAMSQGDRATEFSARTDVVQLGMLALSLTIGRRVEALEYPGAVPALLDGFSRSDAGKTPDGERLRAWLNRALQVDHEGFASGQEAVEGFHAVPEPRAPAPSSTAPVQSVPVAAPTPMPTPVAVRHEPSVIPMPTPRGQETAPPPQTFPVAPARVERVEPKEPESMASSKKSRRFTPLALAAAALLVVAIGEGAVIAILLSSPNAMAAPVVVAHPAPAAAMAPTVTASMPATPAPPAPVPPPPVAVAPVPAAPAPAPAPAPERLAPGSRFGGVRVNSPIELKVYEQGKLVGSTAGPIALNEGTHILDIDNDVLAFHARQTVEVKAGQMAAVSIAVPNGQVSINAVPWASVTIDGAAAGDTPLANLSVPIGEHEVVFKHPQFGEQKQTLVVKADGAARISANMQRPAGR